jgi:hypothetical protein
VSSDDYARAVIAEGQRKAITERGIVIALATVIVESGYPIRMWANRKVPESLLLPHDAVGNDGFSCGLFQQQVVMGDNGWWWGDCATCMNPAKSAGLFYDRLARLDYDNTANSPGSYAQAIQRSAFPGRYDERMDDAQELYNRLAGGDVPDNRPDFNEFPIWSSNNSDRGGTKVDCFLLHTQEAGGGDSAAEDLAKWFANANGVSYHYTVSQASDGGVTVVDCVDTDRSSWSVLSANSRSINLCFAGSRAGWTRQQWLDKAGRAIDVAAYLAVADARKYGFAMQVIRPPYTGRIPGISDHRYVTKVLGDGTHTDVGDHFPWDDFSAAVVKYASGQPPTPDKPSTKRFPDDWTERELLIEILRQQRGLNLDGWPQLGGRTAVDYLAHLGQKIDALAQAESNET